MAPKTIKELLAAPPAPCPLCNRPNHYPSDHHLIPRSRGGKETLTICRDCHDVVHAFFSNKQLESDYTSVEALLADNKFEKAIAWLSKQDPTRRTKTKQSKDRNG